MAPTRPRIEPAGDGVALTLSGELDAYDAPALRAAFTEAVAGLGETVVGRV